MVGSIYFGRKRISGTYIHKQFGVLKDEGSVLSGASSRSVGARGGWGFSALEKCTVPPQVVVSADYRRTVLP